MKTNKKSDKSKLGSENQKNANPNEFDQLKDNMSKDPESKPNTKGNSRFGILGSELSSRFSAGGNRGWRPTKPGGRNGQGKPT